MSIFRRPAPNAEPAPQAPAPRAKSPAHHTVVEDGGHWTAPRVLQTLKLMFTLKGYRPPTLPTVAVEIIELSRKSEVEICDVVALLERDAMIAGRVLKVAQSPIYASTTPMVSLKQAVLRLGLHTMRDLVLEAAVNMRVFRTNGYVEAMERVRRHATATAYVARYLSQMVRGVPPEHAFLGGLLHDVGIAGSLIALGDVPKQHTPAKLSSVWHLLDEVQGEAGAVMAKAWDLPKPLAEAIAEHHAVSDAANPLTAALCVAESIANGLGYGIIPQSKQRTDRVAAVGEPELIDHQSDNVVNRAMGKLGISPQRLHELTAEVKAGLDELPVES